MIFPKKTVDSVLSALRATIADLGTVESDKLAEQNREEEAAREATQRAESAGREAGRAAEVKSRLEALIA